MKAKVIGPLNQTRRIMPSCSLPLTPNIADIREWNVEVDPPGVVLPVAVDDGTLKVSLHRILVETGIAMTPASGAWDPRSWYALYKYGADFAGTNPKLEFYEGILNWDSRLSAVASEEIAAGIACYVLREHFDLPHIADVEGLLASGELKFVSDTDTARPDFFCEDLTGNCVIAESKGAIGTRCRVESSVKVKGRRQVENVVPTSLPLRPSCNRVVIGTHFCVHNKNTRSDTGTIISDPDGPDGDANDPSSDHLVRAAYSKALRFAGQDELANNLLHNRPSKEIFDREALSTVGNLQVYHLNDIPGFATIGLLPHIAKTLFTETSLLKSKLDLSSSVLADFRGMLGKSGYILPNGVVIVIQHGNEGN